MAPRAQRGHAAHWAAYARWVSMVGLSACERIPLHVTAYLDNGATLRAFRNRWRHMPEATRERYRAVVRQAARWDPMAPRLAVAMPQRGW